ncbi:MAG: restriction endonuclease [Geminocystis sp. GBBB08]|nr:restriction endonuclease [Geminocystis sp. GBBB08]
MKPIQKILFGSPGTGKSYQIREIAQQQLNIQIDEFTKTSPNIVKAVFHPEYSYADFMGKLLPFTQGSSVIYKFYPGHFLKILGKAYKSLIEGKNENYLLVIDELNRGNSAAIFGNIFQLLDRESDGWSSYEIDISEMELVGLFQAMKLSVEISSNNKIRMQFQENGGYIDYSNALKNQSENLKNDINNNGAIVCSILLKCQIKLPPNLSIIATINTSDESIYYLDTAFKRRWDWEFVNALVGAFFYHDIPLELLDVKLIINDQSHESWYYYIVGINELIKSNYQTIRRIEDKMIGWWFIKPENDKIELQKVKDKLMFYLWDSVFARDKRPLENFLSDDKNSTVKLALYSDFLNLTEVFLDKVLLLGKT